LLTTFTKALPSGRKSNHVKVIFMLRQFAAALLASAFIAPAAFADTVIYSNTGNYTGNAFANGGTATQAGNQITRLVADRVQTTAVGAPIAITQFSFSVANLNAGTVLARPRVRFYDDDGAGGTPGTYITGFSFNAISFGAGVTVYSATAAFTVPGTDGSFWAGITFDDNNGATGATAAQLNNLGQGIYDPPTVGSSFDSFFVTNAAGSFLVNNPAGTVSNFGGAPIANFGWVFQVATPVPEPAVAMLSLFGLPLLGVAVFLRRRHGAA
jgi:hypothetical protein